MTRSIAERAELLAKLARKERKGSRPRCVLLTDGLPADVTRTLAQIAGSDLGIEDAGSRAPNGFANPREVTLGNCAEAMLTRAQQRELATWWLADPSSKGKLPTWDIVARGQHGLLLVEAKAHAAELTSARAPKSTSAANRASIARALAESTAALNAVIPGWNLAHGPYQLANRIAWAWKVASLGVPVALVYLGFRHADEMDWRRYHSFMDHEEWERVVRNHARDSVPSDIWGQTLQIGTAWLRLDIQSLYVPLPHPCAKCGGQMISILYGEPTRAAGEAARRDRAFVIGGCMVRPDAPTRECRKCGATAGRLDESGNLQ